LQEALDLSFDRLLMMMMMMIPYYLLVPRPWKSRVEYATSLRHSDRMFAATSPAPSPTTHSPFFGNRGHIPGIKSVEASKLTPHLPDNTGC